MIWQKFTGECIEMMKGMCDDAFDAVVTSPPYNIGVDYGPDIDDKKSVIDYGKFTREWVTEALRVAPVAVINFGAPTSSPHNIARFMMDCDAVGDIQQDIIWLKSLSTPSMSMGHFKPVNSKRYITNLYEHVFIVVRKGQTVELDRLAVGVPFADKSNINRFSSNTTDCRCRGNVWYVPYETRTGGGEKHPATFPQRLAEMMIRIVGADTVLDPFSGADTTGNAARTVGCSHYVGIDLRDWGNSNAKRIDASVNIG